MVQIDIAKIYGSMALAAFGDPTGVALIAVIGFGMALIAYKVGGRSV